VSIALLVVLESLSESERAAFILHDVFGYAFDEVAQTLGVTAQTARQQASRARKAVQARRPRFPASPERQRELIVAFGQAAYEGDMDRLLEILHPDVVFTSDGGGVVTAARKPLEGADRVARAMVAMSAKGGTFELVDVNGEPGVLGHGPDGITTVMAFTVDAGRITALDIQRNPEKLRRLP
jgi:RNA polymerase sigma-70 factor (ECF subfamily)